VAHVYAVRSRHDAPEIARARFVTTACGKSIPYPFHSGWVYIPFTGRALVLRTPFLRRPPTAALSLACESRAAAASRRRCGRYQVVQFCVAAQHRAWHKTPLAFAKLFRWRWRWDDIIAVAAGKRQQNVMPELSSVQFAGRPRAARPAGRSRRALVHPTRPDFMTMSSYLPFLIIRSIRPRTKASPHHTT
jgi:hypothetical protein